MGNRTTRRGTRMGMILLTFAFVLVAGAAMPADAGDRKKTEAAPAALAKEMIGTWVLCGKPDKVTDPPASGGRLKFLTGKHWCITQADPNTGQVIYHHGGTYTLNGDTYRETVEYANESTATLIKKTFKFKIKVEGDTLTQTALGDDNPYTEVWKRAK